MTTLSIAALTWSSSAKSPEALPSLGPRQTSWRPLRIGRVSGGRFRDDLLGSLSSRLIEYLSDLPLHSRQEIQVLLHIRVSILIVIPSAVVVVRI